MLSYVCATQCTKRLYVMHAYLLLLFCNITCDVLLFHM